ncbi:MAG: hypothetical protein AAGF58_07310 [Pseudomonadota bacterium]
MEQHSTFHGDHVWDSYQQSGLPFFEPMGAFNGPLIEPEAPSKTANDDTPALAA